MAQELNPPAENIPSLSPPSESVSKPSSEPESVSQPAPESTSRPASEPPLNPSTYEFTTRLLASTGTTYNGSILNSQKNELLHIRDTLSPVDLAVNFRLLSRRKRSFENTSERNVFKTVEWTPDGSSVVTTSEDDGLRLFIVPSNLLDERPEPHPLQPESLVHQPSTIYSSAIYPYFQAHNHTTTYVATSSPNRPISVTNILYPNPQTLSFPIFDAQTERYLPAYSLLFYPQKPNLFFAGSESRICIFDIRREGDQPHETIYTIPSKKAPLNTCSMKGLVSSLACSGDGILAAGTFTSYVGLYDTKGQYCSTISTFRVPQRSSPYAGQGVTNIKWSPCGTYLYVMQRKSSCVLIYDVRNTGNLVGVFDGVAAQGNQRISMQVLEDPDHYGQVVTGGLDGWVRYWDRDKGEQSVGGWEPEVGGTVTGVAVHGCGNVVATCGGRRWFAPDDDEDDEDSEDDEKVEGNDVEMEEGNDVELDEDEAEDEDEDEPENSLKIWKI